jgi:cell division protein FtsB
MLAAYFSAHALAGQNGLLAWIELQKQTTMLQSELESVRAERIETSQRIARLRDASLDLDYVEERAREVLGYARPTDVILRLGGTDDSRGS